MSIQQHPNYAKLTTHVETLVSLIKARQAEYFVAKGRYFQGLRIPSLGKQDGTGAGALLDVGKHPSDQEDSWNSFASGNFKTTSKLPFHLEIQAYAGPAGHGWILTIHLWKTGIDPDLYGNTGDHWTYRHHEGPEMPLSGIWDDWFVQDDNITG